MKHWIISIFIFQTISAVAVEIGNPDFIKYRGEYLMIHNTPMEVFFKKYPELAPKNAVTVIMQMSKDYSAIYEIKNGDLYLIELNYSRYNEADILENVNWITETFKDQNEVKLDWFTSTLIIYPRTRNFEKSTSEKFHLVKILKGKVKEINELTVQEFQKLKHRLFKKYKKTEEFKLMKKKYSNSSNWQIENLIIGNSIFDLMSKHEK